MENYYSLIQLMVELEIRVNESDVKNDLKYLLILADTFIVRKGL